jgi:hypothetical protein
MKGEAGMVIGVLGLGAPSERGLLILYALQGVLNAFTSLAIEESILSPICEHIRQSQSTSMLAKLAS